MAKTKNTNFSEIVGKILRHQLVIPVAAFLILIVFNFVFDIVNGSEVSFFALELGKNGAGDPVITGNIMSILNNGSELAILAIGMTLVTAATGGQDISVGATIAIAGSAAVRIICGSDGDATSASIGVILLAFLVACIASTAAGAFNGILVSVFKIQPMIATLILFTAGRSIASWINGGELPTYGNILDPIGQYLPNVPIPTPIFIAIGCMIITALVLKFTNLRLYTQSVGINESSSRLNGINPVFIKFITFVLLGLCVAVAGMIKVGRNPINYSVIAKDIEMDAILAVALGGNALSGGKFNMTASIMGAYIIQFLTTTLYRVGVDASALPAYKAVVVIVLVILSAPLVRDKIKALGTKLKNGHSSAKEVA